MIINYYPSSSTITIILSSYETCTFEELASEKKMSVSHFISCTLNDYFDSIVNSIY